MIDAKLQFAIGNAIESAIIIKYFGDLNIKPEFVCVPPMLH